MAVTKAPAGDVTAQRVQGYSLSVVQRLLPETSEHRESRAMAVTKAPAEDVTAQRVHGYGLSVVQRLLSKTSEQYGNQGLWL